MVFCRVYPLCLVLSLALGSTASGLAQDGPRPGVAEASARAARKLDQLSSRVLQQLGEARAQNRHPAVQCLDQTLSQLNVLKRRLDKLEVDYLGESRQRRRTKLRLVRERIAALTCQASACLPPLKRSR